MKNEENELLRDIINNLENKSVEYRQKISSLEENYEQQSIELDLFRNEADQLKNNNHELQNIIANNAARTQTILAEMSKTEQDLIDAQQRAMDLSVQNNQLIHEFKQSKSLIESLQSTAIKDKQEASDTIEKLEKKYNAKISKLQEQHRQELNALHQSNNELSSKLEKKDKTVSSQNREIQVLNKYLIEMTQEHENLIKKFKESQASSSLQREIDFIPWTKSQKIQVSRQASTIDTESNKDVKTFKDELNEISHDYDFSRFFSEKKYTFEQLKELWKIETDKKKKNDIAIALEVLDPKNYAQDKLWQVKFDSSKSGRLEQNSNSNLPNHNLSNKPQGPQK